MKAKLHTTTQTIQAINHIKTGRGFRADRIRARISLRQLAKAGNCSAPYVSDLERGRRQWTQARLNFWVNVLANLIRTKNK